ncbi:hypothetical protein [Gloeobacter kilaueensis]|uniref:Uncharacterized protein n=1 Tax=Gloeobacter kilaueensis (strain ATCC BAA-2537 / CCAP 1431/1 / ULC 316 / JS1) TaxID=1183438 RepID=U5QGM3_GLOK1|nr:hypothetical protein [Gloeobacter kilaueensis]AGY58028.1 hypothetical protein GKIL_1782 [Gloeobacter kilaueensis JS1]
MDELSPILRSLGDQPLGFFGGFVAGLLRLNPLEDPVKGWLIEQLQREGGSYNASSANFGSNNGSSKGPQSIAID